MAMIRQLTKSLKEDQLPALASALTPEQLMMLMELHKMISAEVEQKNAADEQAKHIVPASADDMRARRRAAEQAQAEEEQPEAIEVQPEEK